MRRCTRLIPFALLLALVSAFAWTPAAEAVAYCSSTYCAGQSPLKSCGCPPHTDRPGAPSTCGGWNRVGGCWYEAAAASVAPAGPGHSEFLASLADDAGAAAGLEAPAPTLLSTSCTTSSQCPTGQLCCYPCGIDGCDIKVCMTPERGRCPMFP